MAPVCYQKAQWRHTTPVIKRDESIGFGLTIESSKKTVRFSLDVSCAKQLAESLNEFIADHKREIRPIVEIAHD